jgi:hypothetical protein
MRSRLLIPLSLSLIGGMALGCSEDDSPNETTTGRLGGAGTGGNGAAGTGGGAGAAGTGGGAGAAGTGGGAGAAGTGGAVGVVGAAGAPGAAGSTGFPVFDGGVPADAGPSDGSITFFVSSRGLGASGGNFGGLEGADALCDELATAVGQGDRTWRAFLSTADVDARDRIGDGPWQGSDGVVLARSLAELFTLGIPSPARALRDENGVAIPSSIHDVVTGTDQSGIGLDGLTCADWTSNLATDQTVVGHADGMGPQGVNANFGWIRAHDTATNCDQIGLAAGGGDGRIYCFAASIDLK